MYKKLDNFGTLVDSEKGKCNTYIAGMEVCIPEGTQKGME